MEFEDELTELFDHATATLRPPVDELLEQSSTRGRRLRRQRTTRVALATLGVTAVVCGTAVGVLSGYSPTHSATVALDAGADASRPRSAAPAGGVTLPASPAKPTATPTATAARALSAPTGQSSSAAGSDVTLGTDYDILRSLLPARSDLQPMPYDWGGTVPGAADAVYNDGHGAAQVSVLTTSMPSNVTCANWLGGTNEGTRPAGATPVSCAETTLPDGDRRLTVVTGVDGSGFYDYEVTLTRTDGTVVIAFAGNGVPEGATVDVTRAVPPLTLAQLQAIAADPSWHLD